MKQLKYIPVLKSLLLVAGIGIFILNTNPPTLLEVKLAMDTIRITEFHVPDKYANELIISGTID